MRRYPHAENQFWRDQEDHKKRGSKDRAASTCRPNSDSFNDASRCRRSNCSTNNSQSNCSTNSPLAEANLKSKRPFRALLLTPEHRQLRLQWCQARSTWNVSQIGKRLCLAMNPGLFWGQMITVYGCRGALEDETDQAIEEPDEIMHINRDSENKYDKSDRHDEAFELNCYFQMLPKELYQEN
ncbi:HTH_Tnp_Tc3_2 domain-containing protein [Trichonephila clavipes]|nr:HTH_Tnp_Tc3_2 domain-containing protein [Trichonephila clavipes]